MADNKQLIERLRADAEELVEVESRVFLAGRLRKAANEIERLEAEVQRMRTTCTECGGIASSEAEMDGWGANSDGFGRCFRCCVARQEGEAKLATLEAERERDAAVLEALSSDGAIEAAADAHERRCAQLHAPTHRESAKVVLRVALQHAQEQVGEDRG